VDTDNTYEIEDPPSNGAPELSPDELAFLATLQNPDEPIPAAFAVSDAIQQQIIGWLATSPEAPGLASIIKPNYWRDARDQRIARILLNYLGKYHQQPPLEVVVSELRERATVETKHAASPKEAAEACYLEYRERLAEAIDTYQPKLKDYLRDTVVRFCQQHAANETLEDAFKAEAGKFDLPKLLAKLAELDRMGRKTGAKRALNIAELEALPPMKWQIEGHFHQSTYIVVYGMPGTGKSFYVLDAALSIAAGVRFMGRWAVQPGPVVYIASEGYRGIAKRVRAWIERQGHRDELLRNLVVIPERWAMNTDPGAADEIRQLAEAKLDGRKPTLYIVDTLNRNLQGSENDPKDMTAFIATTAQLAADADASLLIVHHCGKDQSKGARGHNSLPGAADTMISIDGKPESRMVVMCEKQKDAAEFAAYYVIGEPEGDSLVLRYDTTVAAESKAEREEEEKKFLDLIPTTEEAAVTVKTLEGLSGMSHGTVSGELARLSQLKRVNSKTLPSVGRGRPSSIYWRTI